MKLFLLSNNLTDTTRQEFKKFLTKEKVKKALFIIAAAVPYGLEERPEWLTKSVNEISGFVDSYDEVTLEEGAHIPDSLDEYDLVFVSGGNLFYLAYRLVETGFDELLKDYTNTGGLYSGSSAGALILMNDIYEFAIADDSSIVPKIYPGLGLINEAIIPHADNKGYKGIMLDISKKYQDKGLEIITLNDEQVYVVDGLEKRII